MLVALVLGVPGALSLVPEPEVSVEIGIPQPLSPQGDLPIVPSVFRWEPGGDDAEWSQVVIYRGNLERIWQSPLLRRADSYEVDPKLAFLGIPAGEDCFWRVRELVEGQARAISAFGEFKYERDALGYGPGELPAELRPLTE